MWQSMETAPRDGTPIQAEIPGNGSDYVIGWTEGFEGASGTVGAWVILEDQEPPACWTDGVCWERNEDEKPSVLPARWKPLPPKQA